jgi:hypothetical protein
MHSCLPCDTLLSPLRRRGDASCRPTPRPAWPMHTHTSHLQPLLIGITLPSHGLNCFNRFIYIQQNGPGCSTLSTLLADASDLCFASQVSHVICMDILTTNSRILSGEWCSGPACLSTQPTGLPAGHLSYACLLCLYQYTLALTRVNTPSICLSTCTYVVDIRPPQLVTPSESDRRWTPTRTRPRLRPRPRPSGCRTAAPSVVPWPPAATARSPRPNWRHLGRPTLLAPMTPWAPRALGLRLRRTRHHHLRNSHALKQWHDRAFAIADNAAPNNSKCFSAPPRHAHQAGKRPRLAQDGGRC